jgi:hypothetical protein
VIVESYYFDNPYCEDYYVKKGKAPLARKYKRRKKYFEKLLCWIVVNPKPYFHRSKETINSQIYKTECIEKKTLLLIKKY